MEDRTCTPKDWAKLNFDGSAIPEARVASVGGITRTETRQIIAGFLGKIYLTNPLHAELKALLDGVQLCLSRNIDNVIIEGDNLTVIESLQNDGAFSCDIMISWRKFSQYLEQLGMWMA